jgi:hypothetical protein
MWIRVKTRYDRQQKGIRAIQIPQDRPEPKI